MCVNRKQKNLKNLRHAEYSMIQALCGVLFVIITLYNQWANNILGSPDSKANLVGGLRFIEKKLISASLPHHQTQSLQWLYSFKPTSTEMNEHGNEFCKLGPF